MANLISDGAAWLAGRLKSHAGTPVVYQRGAARNESITAVVGETEFETEDEQGIVISAVARDFLIAAADLTLNDVVTEPQDGDVILETVEAVTFTYEVTPIADGKHYRPSDPYGIKWRIHTKLIGKN